MPILTLAGLIAAFVAVAHSVLGEIVIFSRLRDGGIVPARPAPPLSARNVAILWATWHITSVFGLGLAAILVLAGGAAMPLATIAWVVAATMIAGGALVLVATRGRHPGWAGLWAVAACCGLWLLAA